MVVGRPDCDCSYVPADGVRDKHQQYQGDGVYPCVHLGEVGVVGL